LTVTVAVFVVEHEPLAPVTVYVVVPAGETVNVVPVTPPGFHVYEEAPLTVSDATAPEQIVAEFEARVGVVVTFTSVVPVPVQFSELVPVTV
jgi:hypothetical protein